VGRRGVCLLFLGLAGCDLLEHRERSRDGALDPDIVRLLNEKDPSLPARREPEPAPRASLRVHAKARFVWIRPRPTETEEWLGYVSQGQSVAVRGDRSGFVPGNGTVCETWVPIEPKGWVCLGRDATLDAQDELYRALAASAARIDSAWPFDYAQSLEAPRYRTLPSLEDQKRREGSHLARLERAKKAKSAEEIRAFDKNLAMADLSLTGEPAPPPLLLPYTVTEGDEDVPFGSTVAYSAEFDHEDRAFVLTSDHAVVPLSRLKRYPRSDFRGVELGEDTHLPAVFFRKGDRPRYARSADGTVERADGTLPPRAFSELTGQEVTQGGRRYLETSAPGTWVDEADVIVIQPEAKPPKSLPATGRGTWVEVSTIGGWLIAYERDEPVFVTLISAGRGDMRPDNTMIEASATPNGTYAVSTKLRAAHMRSENRPGRVHAEVMYTQVFHGAFALHGAYWHDEFGDRKSAGCVNLSPIDAKWIFDWSEPRLPEGWHAMTARASDEATAVVIHP
jgi:hypothetical protein